VVPFCLKSLFSFEHCVPAPRRITRSSDSVILSEGEKEVFALAKTVAEPESKDLRGLPCDEAKPKMLR
jgi:hypothetical protein